MKGLLELNEKAFEAACDAFEPLSGILRYRGRVYNFDATAKRSNWHTCDRMAMRHAIQTYLAKISLDPDLNGTEEPMFTKSIYDDETKADLEELSGRAK